MTQDDRLTLALLDRTGRPVRVEPLASDWRHTLRRLVADEGSWIALFQQRAPTRSPTPGPADIALTRALIRILRPLDLRLADHVIQAGEARFSFRAAGLL
ncbi:MULTISPECIES: JAB domain-containing protein [unclassified Sphingobium]|uniref:JAB domain-containing protein n=1 Tax=unclassified Sphingobium TaxID=2611147 RepID=UPI0035A62670